jgi:hypothetical protein
MAFSGVVDLEICISKCFEDILDAGDNLPDWGDVVSEGGKIAFRITDWE